MCNSEGNCLKSELVDEFAATDRGFRRTSNRYGEEEWVDVQRLAWRDLPRGFYFQLSYAARKRHSGIDSMSEELDVREDCTRQLKFHHFMRLKKVLLAEQ